MRRRKASRRPDRRTLPLRLAPGVDLRKALEAVVEARRCPAFVLAGIGSLSQASLRLAGALNPTALQGDLEILTLSGTVTPKNGAHLHASVADAAGTITGGHVAYGCAIRTTAEILLMLLPGWSLSRELDPATGFLELVVRR